MASGSYGASSSESGRKLGRGAGEWTYNCFKLLLDLGFFDDN